MIFTRRCSAAVVFHTCQIKMESLCYCQGLTGSHVARKVAAVPEFKGHIGLGDLTVQYVLDLWPSSMGQGSHVCHAVSTEYSF
jgi:hypothetical protein